MVIIKIIVTLINAFDFVAGVKIQACFTEKKTIEYSIISYKKL